MSLLKFAALAAFSLSAVAALAGDAHGPSPSGAWQPPAEGRSYTDRTVLVFNDEGRFAAFVADGSGLLDAASGSWMLAEDGGELVLAFDDPSANKAPGTTRYLQMLLVGDELRPYPGMEGRSPLAATSWQRVEGAFADGSTERASR